MGALLAVAGIFASVVYSFQYFVSVRHYEPDTLPGRFKHTPNPFKRYIIWFFAARTSPNETTSFWWFSLAGLLFFLFSWFLMHINYLFLGSKYGGGGGFLETVANLLGIFACSFLTFVFLMGMVFISLPAFEQKVEPTTPEARENGDDVNQEGV